VQASVLDTFLDITGVIKKAEGGENIK